MIDGEGVPSGRARTVRLKVPAHWRYGPQSAFREPPQYKPCPDTLLSLQRCVWDLTPFDCGVPAKLRKCSRCGKLGSTSYPLYERLLFVEYF